MPLKLAQFQYQEGAEHGGVTPENDAELFHAILRSCHMIRPVAVTALGGNQLLFRAGSGVIYGRFFEITEETISIPVSPSGDLMGRTVIRIDIGNAAEPICWLHQSGASLPALVQENLQTGGAVFDVPICTYMVSTLAVSNLSATPLTGTNIIYRDELDPASLFSSAAATAIDSANPPTTVDSALTKLGTTANTAKTTATSAATTANNAMPKAGGTFTGTVTDTNADRNGYFLRAAVIQNSAGTAVASSRLIFRRK